MKPKRKTIPSALAHQVRDQCDGACANPSCREWNSSTHEIHHIDGDRSNSTLENLILLCSNCHSKEQSGIITRQELEVWKGQAKLGRLPWPRQPLPAVAPIMGDNYGVIGSHVHIENLTVKQPRRGSSKSPLIEGTIGANADMRDYANYLVKRYIKWRKMGIEQGIDRRRFSPGSAPSILAEGFGSQTVLMIPSHRFAEWLLAAQKKIDNTIWGKQNPNRNYHTWEEHQQQRHQGKARGGN